MKHFISLFDVSEAEILGLLDAADRLKAQSKSGVPHALLPGKTLAMVFSKSSTRTRVSFEVGMYQLGGHALFLNANDIQLGRGEPVADTARVLSRMVDGIMIRTYSHQDVLDLARFGSIPVINGLTDLHHPCQILADLMTVREQKGSLRGLRLAYIGDGNNVANSLLHGCAKVGMDIAVATPAKFACEPSCISEAREAAAISGSRILLTNDPREAAENADVVYTDTWVSMGQEAEKASRVAQFAGFEVDSGLMALARRDAVFLHCLPAYRGYEVSAEVIDGPRSFVFDQAENRLHAQKAVLATLMA